MIGKPVNYLGKKYGNDKASILSKAGIFVFPTVCNNEFFSLFLLEVMQFSRTILSTVEGWIPEMVDDGKSGSLIPQKDAMSIANKLEILINDENLRKKTGQREENATKWDLL